MRVAFVNRYAWPDHAATAQQLADLSESLAARGHEVTVVASAGRYRGEGETLPRSEEHRGVRYERLRSFAPGGAGLARRLFDYLAFHWQARAWLRSHAHELDAVVSLTDPPALALHANGLKGVRSVVWCMDILSEAALALGVLRSGSLAARLAGFVERRSLRQADLVVALGDCMAQRLAALGVEPRRVRVIGVWADAREIPATPPGRGGLRRELGLEDRFVVGYSGNAGRVHDFEAVKQAMELLREEERVVFLFAGGGPRMPELERFAKERALPNARFLPYFERDRLGEALSLPDAHLVTLRRGLEGVVVPCKTYGAMMAGRPLLAAAPGASTLAREVQQAGAGAWLPPEDGAGLAAAIRRLAAEPAFAAEQGARGRAFAELEHDRSVCAARWELLLQGLVPAQRR